MTGRWDPNEKLFRAERLISRVRLVMVGLGVLFLLVPVPIPGGEVQRPLAIWVLGLTAALVAVLFRTEPWRRASPNALGWTLSVVDVLLATGWMAATGGLDSPYWPVYLITVASVAARFDRRSAFLAGLAHLAVYLALGLLMGQLGRAVLPLLLLRSSYILILAWICGALASESLTQAEGRRRMEDLAGRAEQARIALSGVMDGRIRVEEAERRRIARELHDEIGQVLTALHLSLDMAGRGGEEARTRALEEAQQLTSDLLARVRNLSLDLRPPMLDDLGLLPALLWQLERIRKQTGIEVELRHSGLAQRFAPEVESSGYRVVQEALTNVARHAGVQRAKVSAWVSGNVLTIQVEDQGAGFDAAPVMRAGQTGGLVGMRERAALAGGQLTVESARGRGTRVTVEMPLGVAKEETEMASDSGEAPGRLGGEAS